ncbi:alpha/beta fold hydrolase [Caenimonas soli]|uniref:alpha/beta fold hydrolase n=1 Tax=Caenimonas soli TaxID=2735555 RepID=UPI001551E968|nr:alpha/beta hydrolase [Caenimonas soli]NPC56853.1 alpha/beta hydrolase [Caenimonas soli]
MPTSAINGVQLYWELSGNGEPVVLVHGSWGDHHNWARVVPALSNTLRVATYDRRGHSRSERPGSGSIADDVEDLARLIEHLFDGPAHVIGNSFGAAIALRLAAQRPDLARSLVVHEPPLFGLLDGNSEARPVLDAVGERIAAVAALLQAGDMPGGAQRFVETVAFGPGAWTQLPQATRETFVFNAPTWLEEIQETESATMALDRLSGFSAPTLLSLGGQSPPFFAMVVERVAQALPHAGRYLFAQAGHVPHLSHPEEYIRVVNGFIRETATPRGASAV